MDKRQTGCGVYEDEQLLQIRVEESADTRTVRRRRLHAKKKAPREARGAAQAA
jgi:hypothetical protein